MIRIYKENEIKIIRQGGKILAKVVDILRKKAKPGVTTQYLNEVAKDLIFSYKAEPSFENYNGFPAALCSSINEEIVHAVPSKRKLKQGDILTLDLGIRYPVGGPSRGYCTDMAITIPIGEITKQIKKLIRINRKALNVGISQAVEGNYLGDIGFAIQRYIEKQGFNVVKELIGHGVGGEVHEEPDVPNYGFPKTGAKLKPGMVLALEPMVAIGDWRIKKTEDGFGYKTADNSLSCHFEHTIVITRSSPEVLTEL